MRHTTVLLLAVLMPALAGALPGWAGEIDFVEDYVLAADKDKAIQQLIPGTERYYYYVSLRHQAAGQFDEVDAILKKWLALNKNRRTGLYVEVEHRQALLRYRRQPEATLKYLKDKLGLRFDHQRQIARKSSLPTRLDEQLIARDTLTKRAFAADARLGGFERSALGWLIDHPLDARRRRHLLEMLDRPDYGGLVGLIAADLAEKDSRGFGSLKIHNLLLKDQLDELIKLKGDLLKSSRLVNLYLLRLRPSDDVDWQEDPAEQLAWLERMWAFVKPLPPAFNSLKAHVLYHRLAFDRARGIYDADLFAEYLKLPRSAPYVRAEYLKSHPDRRYAANLRSDYRTQTLRPPIGSDEPLIRSYLERLLVKADSYSAYATWLDDSYLKRVFAETKLLAGVGDAERWVRLLSASQYKALIERVDLDFAADNRKTFAPGEKVHLDVYVKNVRNLIVKIYRINALKYYQQLGRPVPVGLDLDGLVPNEQKTHTYTDAPLRRIRRRFELPSLAGRGVYVIELIGSGKRSRALVRKGRLGYLVRTTPAGQEVTLLDEQGAKLRGAKLWLAGHLYEADEDGTITVPFTNRPTTQKIVLISGEAASLASLRHDREQYALQCGFYADREALLARRTGQLLVRPQLRLNGTPVSLSLLKEVELRVASTDLDGVRTTRTVKDFKLFEDRESLYEFRTPVRLSRIDFHLVAKVKNLSANRTDTLSAGKTFRLNAIDATAQVEDVHLLRADGKYVLEMRGRNAEPMPERPVLVKLKHRDFKRTVDVSLKTDASGRIMLGRLKDIVRIESAHGQNMSVRHTWHLGDEFRNLPAVVHARAGEVISLPHTGPSGKPLRSELSLLELRGGGYAVDRFGALKVRGGMLEMHGLPPGDYSLLLKRAGRKISVVVTEGKKVAGYVTSPGRRLELREDKRIQIVDVKADKEAVTIRLAGATKFTRVHLIASRYMPEYPLLASMHPFGWLAPIQTRSGKPQCDYVAGRRISDEYRYILDRQYAKKLPGNLLKRPTLILNPWSPRATDTGRAAGRGGESIESKSARPGEAPAARFFGGAAGRKAVAQNYANLDFLANGAVVLVNLRPDKNGVVTVQRKLLLDKQHVRVLAVDTENSVARELTLAEVKPALRDLRLAEQRGLDPKQHYTQQKKVTPAAQGKPFVLRDVTTTRFETFDSLRKVYRLYVTVSGNATLREFAFVLNWPKLKDDEKRKLYSKYACHELHFFLYRRDPEFFRAVVLPYLKNKKDKTFLDRWLCGEDLAEYMLPWRHARLNVVERILLARRIEAEQAVTARHVADLHDLLTPDVDRFNRLFDTAVGLGRLSAVTKTRVVSLVAGKPSGGAVRAGALGVALDDLMEKDAKAGTKTAELALRRARKAPAALRALAAARPAAASEAAKKYAASERKREAVRQYYRKLGLVREWVESNYYHLGEAQATAGLITVNAFWRDYAAFSGEGKFLSPHLAEACRNFPEMMFALAAIDLPFDAPKHEIALKGNSLTITPSSAAVIFHEEVNPTGNVPKVMPILVSQNFYRHGSRYRHVGGEKIDNFVTDEFLAGVVYGCHVVVTNPTSSRRKLQVLVQIPRGAVPVAKGDYTKTVHILLEPYRTHTFDTMFYFPAEGRFEQYPVHVSRRGELTAFAKPAVLNVVKEPSKIDRTSWEYVSQHGSRDDVLAFLRDNNLHRIDLGRIAWRMKDKGLFQTVLELLARRHVYHGVLWSYGIKHNVPAAVREYLQHHDSFARACGAWLDSPLLTIDPVVRKAYQHVEYWPLVNARAHRFGPRRKILVQRLHEQYHRLMNILKYRAALSDEDRMALVHYLLVQDRVEEAMGQFKQVNSANLAERLQYDYCAAYLDFFNDKPAAARKIAQKHRAHPVERWRNLFAAVLAQLDEIEGKGVQVLDKKDHTEVQTGLAAGEKTFEFTVEAKKITLNYQNLTAATVNYYLMDIELMFSRQPFVQNRGGQFAYIQPNHTQRVKLPTDKKTVTVDLPAELHNRNVMVEVAAGGKLRTQAYFSHSLVVQMMENYGQLRVTHRQTSRPMAKVYVKVYAKMPGGRVEFYKDGYTDLRGRFDYTSLNTDQLAAVQQFAVLVLSEADGSTVREAKPPKR